MVVEGLLQHIDRMAGLQGNRDLCGQYFPARPINNGNKVDKPFGHGDIRRVQRPDLVGLIDGQAPKQVEINLALRDLVWI